MSRLLNKSDAAANASSDSFANAPLRQLTRDNALSGWQVGQWLLGRLLGRGGMSVVYEGTHLEDGRIAAIKLLHPGLLDDEDNVARLRREAAALERLDHPNIIQIYECERDPQVGFYMALERLHGQDLGSVFGAARATAQPIPLSWLMLVAEQICDALGNAHEEGIIHRDLKPGNIFLLAGSEDPIVKVLDFGIAKVEHKQDEERLTATGAILGTPSYLAPEQIKSQAKTTPATDLYALGVILYEALTGQLPIDGDSGFEHLLRVVQAVPKSLGEHRPEFDDTELEEVIMRMLAKVPEERPSDADMCWSELSIAGQFVEDPLDLPEHYPEIVEASSLLSESAQLSPVQPLLFSTDGDEVKAISAGSSRPLQHQTTGTSPSGRLMTQSGEFVSVERSQSLSSSMIGPDATTKGQVWLWILMASMVCLGLVGGLFWSSRNAPNVSQVADGGVKVPQRVVRKQPVQRRLIAGKAPVRKAMSPEALLQQARALRHYQQAHSALQKAKVAAKSGAFVKAAQQSKRFNENWRKFRSLDARGLAKGLSLKPEALQPSFRLWDTLSLSLQLASRAHVRADFRQAGTQRKRFLAALKSHPRRAAFMRSFQLAEAREKRAQRLLLGASSAYRKGLWRKALKRYGTYALLFPKARNRGFVRRRRKACRCALKDPPWEICTSRDYPRHFKGKGKKGAKR